MTYEVFLPEATAGSVEARNAAVDFTTGAAMVMPGLTAWQGLFEHGRLRAGQSVVVQGVAGAVGSMASRLAREAGTYVIRHRAGGRQAALDFGAQEFVDLVRTPSRTSAGSIWSSMSSAETSGSGP